MNGRQETEDKQLKFLRYLYDHEDSARNGMFEAFKVGKTLGFSDAETKRIAGYLLEGNMIRLIGSGGDYLIKLTAQGRTRARTGSYGPEVSADATGVHAPNSDAEHSVTRGLTPGQKDDYDTHGFKCRDEIHIAGEFKGWKTNVVEVNGHPLVMGDRTLELLLRLAVASKSSQDGWLDADVLIGLGIDPSEHKYQPLMRLQNKLGPGLLDKNPKDLIEGGYNSQRKKRYRISTHPDFVTYDKGKLLKHPNDDVKRLAAELP